MLARVRSCFLLSFLFVFSMVPYQSVHAQINPAYPATSQRKKIKDPAECKLYISAVQQIDAAAKIGSLEAFLIRYPDSVMKEDALELLMGAYQQAGNQTKVVETAQNILQVNACNLRALAVLAFTKQAMATAGQNAQQNLTDAAQARRLDRRAAGGARRRDAGRHVGRGPDRGGGRRLTVFGSPPRVAVSGQASKRRHHVRRHDGQGQGPAQGGGR